MTKQEFVDKIASKTDLSRRDAAKAVDAFLDTITESLQGGEEVAFTGFGKFSTQRRAARQGVNPRNPSESINPPAVTSPGTGLTNTEPQFCPPGWCWRRHRTISPITASDSAREPGAKPSRADTTIC